MKRRCMMRRWIIYIFIMALTWSQTVSHVHAADYSDYSNESIAFGLNLRTDHKKPDCEKPSGVKLSDYDTYYYNVKAYQNHDKVIYLSFDCGYENGHTGAILDALKEADIKAIFFVTEPYVKDNANMVKRMKEEGHLVGNHTCTHPRLSERSVSQIQEEISQCADTMKKLTGYEMDPYVRPPEGVYSVRVMKVLQDMGYSTMLWSLAIYDYDEDNQPGADYVVEKFKKHHFCGMLPLLHVISSSDTEALPDVISAMEEEGYRFGEVSEFLNYVSEEEKQEMIRSEAENISGQAISKIILSEQNVITNAVTELIRRGNKNE